MRKSLLAVLSALCCVTLARAGQTDEFPGVAQARAAAAANTAGMATPACTPAVNGNTIKSYQYKCKTEVGDVLLLIDGKTATVKSLDDKDEPPSISFSLYEKPLDFGPTDGLRPFVVFAGRYDEFNEIYLFVEKSLAAGEDGRMDVVTIYSPGYKVTVDHNMIACRATQ